MVKIGDRDLTADQLLVVANGAVAIGNGMTMLVQPEKPQSGLLIDSKSRSNFATRMGGTALTALGASSVAAGLNKDPVVHKGQAKVVALHQALMCGLALNQASKPAGERAAKLRALQVLAIGGGINSMVMAWRGFRKN
eukprot:TRINITY_DN1172_c0_g1_i2.p3 TRINITY_DN1172_c0_g1~~TRINITY_DN1172_c0_g1_i2.p3  ORF type:complete len:138 (+),score=26.24 TRINITY_DN1172_c0_g1_i2:196-609(+)